MFTIILMAAVKCSHLKNIFGSQVDHFSALAFYHNLGDMINTM